MLQKRRNCLQRSVQPDVLKVANPDICANQLHCEICLKKDRGEQMLICDGCDCGAWSISVVRSESCPPTSPKPPGFHMFCLDPPLSNIPRGQWFCHICLFGTGGDFGFDEGEEHSLSSFQARDREFRRLWFLSHPPQSGLFNGSDSSSSARVSDPYANRFGNMVVTEDDVELEFWRLVQTPTETVEVEYGADVHSTTHGRYVGISRQFVRGCSRTVVGSGMPSLETHPLDPYSKDPWNLNNIPILPQSLLRYIKSDISGMTVPWTYVGMIFSTFCWHNEVCWRLWRIIYRSNADKICSRIITHTVSTTVSVSAPIRPLVFLMEFSQCTGARLRRGTAFPALRRRSSKRL